MVVIRMLVLCAFCSVYCFAQQARFFAEPLPHTNAIKVDVNLDPNTRNSVVKFWDFRTLRTLACAGMGALIISGSDYAIDEEYSLERDASPFGILDALGQLGHWYDSKYTFLALGSASVTAIGYSWFKNKPEMRKTVFQMWESLAITSAITYLLKVNIGRQRPYMNNGPYEFDPKFFVMNTTKMSFPSGHTSSVFALMTVLAKRSSSVLVKSASYTLASAVAFQRMLDRKHWASDVLFGGALGYCVGSWIVNHGKASNKHNFVVIAPIGRKTLGVSMNF